MFISISVIKVSVVTDLHKQQNNIKYAHYTLG